MGSGRASAARLVHAVVVFGALGGLLVMHGLSAGHQMAPLPVAHTAAAQLPVGDHHPDGIGIGGRALSGGVAGSMAAGTVTAGSGCPDCLHEAACVAVLRAAAAAAPPSVVAAVDPAAGPVSGRSPAVVGQPWRGPPGAASPPELCISRT
jgi:hypothetical protein